MLVILVELWYEMFWNFFFSQTLCSYYVYRRVPDIRSVIVNLDRYHTTNRLAAYANVNGPVTGGCPISSMVAVNIHGQHLYRELNLFYVVNFSQML